ncbi:MAG: PIN domain-containing protein [Kiritimatiellales bacterium]|nr:PIN domain-containing protein [Kiritimatiellales bacterium]
MTKPVIMDTGPLVAIANAMERHHTWAFGQLKHLDVPILTCEAVLTEACFLLGRRQHMVFELLESEFMQIGFSLQNDWVPVQKLIRKYADVPMSLADACLVRMSEIYDGSKIFTLDGDFKIYRRNGRQVIPLICPEQD